MILNYQDIITQLRNNTSNVFKYIAFCISPQQLTNLSANPNLPAIFVCPEGKDIDKNMISNNRVKQEITENFGVIVQFSPSGDLLAQSSMTLIPTFRETIRKAIVGWNPISDRTQHPIIERNDELWDLQNGAIIYWAYHYSITYQITPDDMYQPTKSASYTSIVIDVQRQITQDNE